MASGRASWRPLPSSAKRAFNACAFLPLLPCLPDNGLDEASVMRAVLHAIFAACRLASSIYIDGVTLIFKIMELCPGALVTWDSGGGALEAPRVLLVYYVYRFLWRTSHPLLVAPRWRLLLLRY